MRRFLLAAAIGSVAALTVFASGTSSAGVRTPQFFEAGDVEDCLELYPAAAGVPVSAKNLGIGENVDLDVYVLLDDVSQAEAEAAVAEAANSYAPLGITLRASGYESVSFNGGDVTPGAADNLFNQVKAHMGGTRPAGSDLVYLLTTTNLYAVLEGVQADGVLGIADCVGGVRYPDHAFAIGENTSGGLRFLGVGIGTFGPHVTMAHEIGHLMGGHHHYANCAQGALSAVAALNAQPCTLMTNFVDFISPDFGALNAVIVRGHAEEWAG